MSIESTLTNRWHVQSSTGAYTDEKHRVVERTNKTFQAGIIQTELGAVL